MALFRGKIGKGAQRGRQLGYPTANISAQNVDGGIYAAKVWVEGVEYRAAVFVDRARALLEAHLLDFSGDLYGKEMKVQLVQRVRESKRFDTDQALIDAIARDIEEIRAILTL